MPPSKPSKRENSEESVLSAVRSPKTSRLPNWDYTRARERMVKEQITNRGIKDRRVIEAIRQVPRHLFIPEALEGQAYGDGALPIGEGQTISQPYMVA